MLSWLTDRCSQVAAGPAGAVGLTMARCLGVHCVQAATAAPSVVLLLLAPAESKQCDAAARPLTAARAACPAASLLTPAVLIFMEPPAARALPAVLPAVRPA